ncbi:MAG: alkaline phosphatase family protein [Acidimicrobiales bacterium]
MSMSLSRRRFLTGSAGVLLLSALPACSKSRRQPPSGVNAALQALGRSTLRHPGSRPDPNLPPATDTLPGIEHVVILMLENHSFDNLFGTLGRGDGFNLDSHGRPTATNPYSDGRVQRAFHMPTTCQLPSTPSNDWTASHNAYDNGANDGFVSTTVSAASATMVGAVAMGYWNGDDLPFTHSLAKEFPIGDRWFGSMLGPTHPNRRFLIAGTSSGLTFDVSTSLPGLPGDAAFLKPVAGTIFNSLDDHGVSWTNYSATFPTGATPELYPLNDLATGTRNRKPLPQFFTDTAAGELAEVVLIDPDYSTQTQENPQNLVVGEALLAMVVNALGGSRLWGSTMLVVTYDESGGYYDHVPPPPAVPPDNVAPVVMEGEQRYDGFARYGFRVPSVVVSPYAKPGHVSHLVYDHTSILGLIERKWNLPALTYRDANANDLTDFLDLQALLEANPTFPKLPPLAPPGDTPGALACTTKGPGTIPPPGP